MVDCSRCPGPPNERFKKFYILNRKIINFSFECSLKMCSTNYIHRTYICIFAYSFNIPNPNYWCNWSIIHDISKTTWNPSAWVWSPSMWGWWGWGTLWCRGRWRCPSRRRSCPLSLEQRSENTQIQKLGTFLGTQGCIKLYI